VPVTADPDLLAQLRRVADEMSTARATQFAIAHGVTPPTDDPAWEMLMRFEADGSEGPLVWVLVSEPTGED
jgi:hypothetical protein